MSYYEAYGQVNLIYVISKDLTLRTYVLNGFFVCTPSVSIDMAKQIFSKILFLIFSHIFSRKSDEVESR
jgi:hypothetical protein